MTVAPAARVGHEPCWPLPFHDCDDGPRTGRSLRRDYATRRRTSGGRLRGKKRVGRRGSHRAGRRGAGRAPPARGRRGAAPRGRAARGAGRRGEPVLVVEVLHPGRLSSAATRAVQAGNMRELDIPIHDWADTDRIARHVEAVTEKRELLLTMKGTLKRYPGCTHWHFKNGR